MGCLGYRMAVDFLKTDHLFLTVGVVGGACSDVEQTFIQVTKFAKREKLFDFLKTIGKKKNFCSKYKRVFYQMSECITALCSVAAIKFKIQTVTCHQWNISQRLFYGLGFGCRVGAHDGVCGDQDTSRFSCRVLVPGESSNHKYSWVSAFTGLVSSCL